MCSGIGIATKVCFSTRVQEGVQQFTTVFVQPGGCVHMSGCPLFARGAGVGAIGRATMGPTITSGGGGSGRVLCSATRGKFGQEGNQSRAAG
jgi:hypothetical protein